MVKEVRIYFEGDKALRPAYHEFLKEVREKAEQRKIGFQVIAGEGSVVRDFMKALKTHPDAFNVLLLNAEGRTTAPWRNARTGRHPRALSVGRIQIPKDDVLQGLKEATEKTQKEKYHKTWHAPTILSQVDAARARKASPHCDRLFQDLLAVIA